MPTKNYKPKAERSVREAAQRLADAGAHPAQHKLPKSDPAGQAEYISEGLAGVAQALINIAEGLTTIENGSRLTRDMSILMRPELANIMRAAPALLEALASLLDRVETGWPVPRSLKDECAAAIAKARGES